MKIKDCLIILISILLLNSSCAPLEGKKAYANDKFCHGADTYFVDFDTRKVVNITRYNYAKLDTSYGYLAWDSQTGNCIRTNDKSPLYLELVSISPPDTCDSNYVYRLNLDVPFRSIGFYEINENELALNQELSDMTYKRVRNFNKNIVFK